MLSNTVSIVHMCEVQNSIKHGLFVRHDGGTVLLNTEDEDPNCSSVCCCMVACVELDSSVVCCILCISLGSTAGQIAMIQWLFCMLKSENKVPQCIQSSINYWYQTCTYLSSGSLNLLSTTFSFQNSQLSQFSFFKPSNLQHTCPNNPRFMFHTHS